MARGAGGATCRSGPEALEWALAGRSDDGSPGEREGAMQDDARRGAWDQFYGWCFEVVRGCPSVRRLSDADREDCVQEVMVELVRRFGEAEDAPAAEQVEGLIRVVSRNKAVDIVRRRYRKPEVGFDDGSGETLASGPRGAESAAEAALGQGESISLVWEALASLDQQVPVTSYLVFYLRSIEGWSIQEIAELFQISAEQARARCHRVKQKFGTIVETKRGRRPAPWEARDGPAMP